MKREMRRKEKAISQEEAIQVLNSAEYGILSTVDKNNLPYGVPMNFAYQDDTIYFHCALEGHRLDNIKANKRVCFNVVDSVVLIPEKFNTQYRSVTVFGEIQVIEDTEEKKKGIVAIVKKLSPDHRDAGMEYIQSAFNDMHVLKLKISRLTGKATR